jgi:hypothetical protein
VSYLSRVNLSNNHVCEAFSAEIVLAARQKCKLVTKEAARADRAQVLFGIELSLEGRLTSLERSFKLS